MESSNPIRYAVNIGERRDLYCTAAGKVLLAGFAPARLKAYLKSTSRQKFTATTIVSMRDLGAELSRVKEDGIARTADERIEGASGLAAPIFSADGEVMAALLIAGPSERMAANRIENERLLKDAAAKCTRLAGGAAGPQQRNGISP